MKLGACTDIGKVRKENEDSFYMPSLEDEIKLFLVADGIGGKNHGKLASMMTIEEIIKFFIKNDSEYKDYGLLMKDAIKYANNCILELANNKSEFSGMGTTLVAGLLDKNKLLLSNAGDSRCYIVRKGIISQLTVDNSYVQYLLEQGAISTKEAKTHPQRNLITKAIGIESDIDVDVDKIDLSPGDILLMCTDGLTTMLSDEDILHIILKKSNNMEDAAKSLVKAAKENGGTDNITAILVEV